MVLAGEIAGTVAHELNTPLGAIVAGSEGMKENIELLFSKLLPLVLLKKLSFAFNLNLDLSFFFICWRKKSFKEKSGNKKSLNKTIQCI